MSQAHCKFNMRDLDIQTIENLPPEQLSMVMTLEKAKHLPDVVLSAGYVLRGYQPGDEQGWVDLLQLGEFSIWDVKRFKSYALEPERTEGSRVVCMGRKIVAATFASQHDHAARVASIDYVISHPEHRGKRLGRAVCTAVLRYLADRGYESVVLFTDDWRLPAIGLYLSLGFVPRLTREDMPSRWEAVMKQLDVTKYEHT